MIKLKNLARSALAATLFAAMPIAGALALPATATTAPTDPTPTPMTAAAAAQAQRLTNLKAKGVAEIDRRLANLTAAEVKLQASTKLSATDKAALAKQLTDEGAGLTTLKAKLAAETTLAAARIDIASIVTDYRVYALMAPKIRLMTAFDRFKTVEGRLIDLQIKLQTKLDAAKAAGKDTAAAQAKMADLLVQIKAAQTAADPVGAKLLALQPTDYNSNHTVLAGYRTNLKTAQTAVKAARDDVQAIVAALKGL